MNQEELDIIVAKCIHLLQNNGFNELHYNEDYNSFRDYLKNFLDEWKGQEFDLDPSVISDGNYWKIIRNKAKLKEYGT